MTLKNLLFSLILTIALGLSGLSIFLASRFQSTHSEKKAGQPDAFMENVVAIVLNKLGKPAFKLEAPSMIHYVENDSTELFEPHVILFRDSSEPWHINANHAKTQQGINEITFWDNVTIHHIADSQNPNTTIRTSLLTLLPNQKIAKTNEMITLSQPQALISANGMFANWGENTVRLLATVREEHAPKS